MAVRVNWVWVAITAIAAAVLLVIVLNGGSKTVSVGDQGWIQVKGSKGSDLAIDKESYDKIFQSGTAQDQTEIAFLVLQGKVFSVENGTPVLVIDSSPTMKLVTILDGPYRAKIGWLPPERVTK